MSRLAAGGMGEVYLARTTGAQGFEKRVVIKRILPHLAGDADFVRRFIDEGKLVVKLRHASIAQVLDMGEDQGVTYLAMEHIDGRDLAELTRLARSSGVGIPLPVIVAVIVRLLDALDYAHRAVDAQGQPMGIIHRDVSPSNVMISRSGEVKLVDFGIAKAAERLNASTSGAIRGKYNYMSPQQAAGAELDARSDQFSVGVLAWELISGQRPFDGTSDLLTLDRIRFHDPGSLADVSPDLPAEVVAAVDRMLAKAPGERFETCDEAMRALQEYFIRTHQLPSSREIAQWVEAVLSTLPAGLRAAPGGGRSLDEVLRLGLTSEPGGVAAAPGSALERPRTATISTDPRVADAAADMVHQAPPSTAEVVAGSQQPLTSPGPTKRTTGFFVTLVALNLLLLGVVAWLALRFSDDEAPAPPPVDAVASSSGADAGPTSAPGEAPLVAVTIDDAGPVATKEADAGTSEVGSARQPRPPSTAGTLFGQLVAASDEVLAAPWITATVHTRPGGASVTLRGKTRRAPHSISMLRGEKVSGRATLANHKEKTFVLDRQRLTVTLTEKDKGWVTFRYRPGTARAFIDGVEVTNSNARVMKELHEGRHTWKIVPREGPAKSRSFTIRPGTRQDATNLGEITADSGS